MAKKEEQVKQPEKKPEAKAEEQVVQALPMAQSAGVRLLVVETDGIRINVKLCSMMMVELRQVLGELDQMALQTIRSAGPLHPPEPPAPPAMPTPPAAEA